MKKSVNSSLKIFIEEACNIMRSDASKYIYCINASDRNESEKEINDLVTKEFIYAKGKKHFRDFGFNYDSKEKKIWVVKQKYLDNTKAIRHDHPEMDKATQLMGFVDLIVNMINILESNDHKKEEACLSTFGYDLINIPRMIDMLNSTNLERYMSYYYNYLHKYGKLVITRRKKNLEKNKCKSNKGNDLNQLAKRIIHQIRETVDMLRCEDDEEKYIARMSLHEFPSLTKDQLGDLIIDINSNGIDNDFLLDMSFDYDRDKNIIWIVRESVSGINVKKTHDDKNQDTMKQYDEFIHEIHRAIKSLKRNKKTKIDWYVSSYKYDLLNIPHIVKSFNEIDESVYRDYYFAYSSMCGKVIITEKGKKDNTLEEEANNLDEERSTLLSHLASKLETDIVKEQDLKEDEESSTIPDENKEEKKSCSALENMFQNAKNLLLTDTKNTSNEVTIAIDFKYKIQDVIKRLQMFNRTDENHVSCGIVGVSSYGYLLKFTAHDKYYKMIEKLLNHALSVLENSNNRNDIEISLDPVMNSSYHEIAAIVNSLNNNPKYKNYNLFLHGNRDDGDLTYYMIRVTHTK